MKLLTLNFLTCARKTCKTSAASFPLHPREAELEQVETDLNPVFITNMLPRLDWEAIRGVAVELGLPALPDTAPTAEALLINSNDNSTDISNQAEQQQQEQQLSQLMLDLHRLLLETCVVSGKLVCGSCGYEYAVKEGIANFLLPSHMV